jgi:hypothetical protein
MADRSHPLELLRQAEDRRVNLTEGDFAGLAPALASASDP